MPTYEFGDTVLVPFHFTDLSLSKRRPSIVLSSLSFNKANGQTIMGMITSATRSLWAGDIVIADLEAAGHVAERIRLAVCAAPVTLSSGFKVPTAVSIGAATLDLTGKDQAIDACARQLLSHADAALYRAKEGGRNRVVGFSQA